MGVGFAILPGFAKGSKGHERAAWVALVLVNLGVVLAGLGPVLGAPDLIPFLGRLAQAGAAAAIAVHAWPRGKSLGA